MVDPTHARLSIVRQCRVALTAEPAGHLPRAVERRLQKLRVDPPQQARDRTTCGARMLPISHCSEAFCTSSR